MLKKFISLFRRRKNAPADIALLQQAVNVLYPGRDIARGFTQEEWQVINTAVFRCNMCNTYKEALELASVTQGNDGDINVCCECLIKAHGL